MEKSEQCNNSEMDLPSSSKDLSKTLPEEAFNNFLQGKRHMLVQDYSFAVQSLATACEMYVKHFGELAIECGEVYFLYGKALFRLSQQQAGVLGGALNEGSNEESEESENDSGGSKENESEKNSDAEGVEEQQPETTEEKEPSESTDSPQPVVDEGNNEAVPKEEAPVEEPSKVPTTNEAEEAKADSTGDAPREEKENQESEEDDLELAWNTLETAKSIFKRQETVEAQLKVAEILQLLAEISMESDNNTAAINDLEESLKIQKKHLKDDDRILAETCYQMGLALMLDKIYPKALEYYKTTKQILQRRLENLKNTPVDESAGSFASADKDIEVTDLENILLDIQEKVEDTEELIRNGEKESKEAFDSAMITSPVKEKEGSKPVSNISHLLKRKKPDDVNSDTESKRLKISPTVPNGETNVPDKTSTEG